MLFPWAQVDVLDAVLKPDRITLVSVLLLVLIAFIRGWVVPKAMYDAEKERADRMEARAFRATDALRSAIDTVETLEKAATTVLQSQRRDGPP